MVLNLTCLYLCRARRSRCVLNPSSMSFPPEALAHHCFTTTVLEGKMDEYVRYHDEIWPEVCRGLRRAGVVSLRIYRLPGTSTLVMNIATPVGLDLGAATGPGSPYREGNARCREWEELMDTVRRVVPPLSRPARSCLLKRPCPSPSPPLLTASRCRCRGSTAGGRPWKRSIPRTGGRRASRHRSR